MSRRQHRRTVSEHLARVVDLSLLVANNRQALRDDHVAMAAHGSDGGNEGLLRHGDEENRASGGPQRVLTQSRGDIPTHADIDSLDLVWTECDEAEVFLRRRSRAEEAPEPCNVGEEARERRSGSEAPLKRHSDGDDILRRRSGTDRPTKRHSDTDSLVRRSSGTDSPAKRLSRADAATKRHSDLDSQAMWPGGLHPPAKLRGGLTLSESSSSSGDSFHTALPSPTEEAPSKVARVSPAPSLPPQQQQQQQDWLRGRTASDGATGQACAVSVRQRIGQIEQELAEIEGRRPGAQPAARKEPWYSNQNEDGHVYYFEEGGTSSCWALPSAENGASQNAKDTEVARRPGAAQVLPPIPPYVRQATRGQRGRSLVVPPASAGAAGPKLRASDEKIVILHQGTLNRTKVATETSRRVRKNWAPCYVVLTDRYLRLFKDIKGAASLVRNLPAGSEAGGTPFSSTGYRPETTVDLAGALVSWESERSSRKNVFQISTVHGLRLLLQEESATTATVWFEAIRDAIARIPQGLDRLMVTAQPHLCDDTRLTRSRSVRFSGALGSQDDLSRDTSTIRDRLRRFFRARPPADALVSRGILKDEPVFGGHLAALCEVDGATVPRFVRECVAAIEARPEHMKMDGVYRASGNLSQVQRIRCEVDQDNYQVLWDEEDVHVLTGALKLFFRELKQPLVPFSVLPAALQAASLVARADQVAAFRRLVADLPAPNRDTLKAVLNHLRRVTELQEFNRMHAHNLAIVFGPTLMWPEQDSPDLALDLMKQNRVVEALLENMADVFDEA